MVSSFAPERLSFFSEWRRLAEAEGQAIQTGNWALAMDCQNALAQLRTSLEPLRAGLRAEAGPDPDRQAALLEGFRRSIAELIALERRNHSWLEIRRTKVKSQLDQADKSRQMLKQIQRSYAGRRNFSSLSTVTAEACFA